MFFFAGTSFSQPAISKENTGSKMVGTSLPVNSFTIYLIPWDLADTKAGSVRNLTHEIRNKHQVVIVCRKSCGRPKLIAAGYNSIIAFRTFAQSRIPSKNRRKSGKCFFLKSAKCFHSDCIIFCKFRVFLHTHLFFQCFVFIVKQHSIQKSGNRHYFFWKCSPFFVLDQLIINSTCFQHFCCCVCLKHSAIILMEVFYTNAYHSSPFYFSICCAISASTISSPVLCFSCSLDASLRPLLITQFISQVLHLSSSSLVTLPSR